MDTTYTHLAIVTVTFLITWASSLRGKFVCDDHEGIARFSDRWDEKTQTKIDYYEDGGKKWNHGKFNPHIGFPVCFLRWFRIIIGRKFQVIGKNAKGHEVYGYVQDPVRHHVLSLAIHYANAILSYVFLSNLLGPNLALWSTLLFVTHPVSVQSVAWISGIGYILSVMWTLTTFIIAPLLSDALSVPVIGILTFFSASALMSGIANWLILLFLGHKLASAVALIVSLGLLATLGKGMVAHRTKAFRDQDMGRSTYITIRKPIIVVKTFFYYLRMLIFPKRLGLFHVWGYHFDEKLERIDGMFWCGLVALIAMATAFLIGPYPIQLGILILFLYLVLFSNVITAQQFIADRYSFASSLGFSIIVAYFLKDSPLSLSFLLGVYMMRTWTHIMSFKDDVYFYLFNILNFPDSEVAYGNLGVILVNRGCAGGAMDIWNHAIKINPFYDVPHYNIYSILKNNGMLEQSRTHLVSALNAKVCHFREMWEKELVQLDEAIARKKAMDTLNARINEAVRADDYETVKRIKDEIANLSKPRNEQEKV